MLLFLPHGDGQGCMDVLLVGVRLLTVAVLMQCAVG